MSQFGQHPYPGEVPPPEGSQPKRSRSRFDRGPGDVPMPRAAPMTAPSTSDSAYAPAGPLPGAFVAYVGQGLGMAAAPSPTNYSQGYAAAPVHAPASQGHLYVTQQSFVGSATQPGAFPGHMAPLRPTPPPSDPGPAYGAPYVPPPPREQRMDVATYSGVSTSVTPPVSWSGGYPHSAHSAPPQTMPMQGGMMTALHPHGQPHGMSSSPYPGQPAPPMAMGAGAGAGGYGPDGVPYGAPHAPGPAGAALHDQGHDAAADALAEAAQGYPEEVRERWGIVLRQLNGTRDQITASQEWFMQCRVHAAGMALQIMERSAELESVGDNEGLMHLAYLAHDILVKGASTRGPNTPPDADAIAQAIRPMLGPLLRRALLAGKMRSVEWGMSTQHGLEKLLALWEKKGVFTDSVCKDLRYYLHNGMRDPVIAAAEAAEMAANVARSMSEQTVTVNAAQRAAEVAAQLAARITAETKKTKADREEERKREREAKERGQTALPDPALQAQWPVQAGRAPDPGMPPPEPAPGPYLGPPEGQWPVAQRPMPPPRGPPPGPAPWGDHPHGPQGPGFGEGPWDGGREPQGWGGYGGHGPEGPGPHAGPPIPAPPPRNSTAVCTAGVIPSVVRRALEMHRPYEATPMEFVQEEEEGRRRALDDADVRERILNDKYLKARLDLFMAEVASYKPGMEDPVLRDVALGRAQVKKYIFTPIATGRDAPGYRQGLGAAREGGAAGLGDSDMYAAFRASRSNVYHQNHPREVRARMLADAEADMRERGMPV